jgi:hypothetical protein
MEKLLILKSRTPCGSPPENDTVLTNELVIEFIDTFFGGVLDNVETYIDEESPESIMIAGGQPTLKKLTISNVEFDKFSISKKFKKGLVENLSDFLEIKKKKFEDIENLVDKDVHPEIICWMFTELVGYYGGSFRCDYMQDGMVDLESE